MRCVVIQLSNKRKKEGKEVMPVYQYRCRKCKEEFELKQSLSDKPVDFCRCGGNLYKVIGSVGFIMKGGGTKTKQYRDGLEDV